MIDPSKSIEPDLLINHISEEADRLAIRRKRNGNLSGKGKSKATQDEVMAATQWDGGKKKCKGKCHNCGKQGHWAHECRSAKKDNQNQATGSSSQSSQPPAYAKSKNKPVGSANTVADSGDEFDGCFSATFVDDESELSWVKVTTPEEGETDVGTAVRSGGLAAAVITQVEREKPTHIKLYDSGATCHISPYRDNFITYQKLDPLLYLNAANCQQFPAIGAGKIVVSVPNGDGHSSLTLDDVLHAPSVGYTLVSLGALDRLGHHMTIGDGYLVIYSQAGESLARITHSPRGLYRCYDRCRTRLT